MSHLHGGAASVLAPAEASGKPCLTCGTAHSGEFCPKCGEKRIDKHDYSLLHFVEHAFESFTHFDFKAFRCLRMLVLRPGRLTREFLDGRRKPYIGPVPLFVIVNVIFALLIGFTRWAPLSTTLLAQESIAPFAEMKRKLIAEKIAHEGVAREEFERAFNAKASLQAKTWVFVMIPVFSLLMAGLYGFRRYFFEHLVFATHFYTFVLLLILTGVYVFSLWVTLAARMGMRLSGATLEMASGVFVCSGIAVYLFYGLRHTFAGSKMTAMLRALALTAAFLPILFAYRFLLFFVTLKGMH